ncbi:MAG: MOSC domain-containing protein [Gammaproteobacteria bacterium]
MQSIINKILIAETNVIGPDDVPTGIFKTPVSDPIRLTDLGLEGDFQADQQVHGGLDKAVHHYAVENYELLKEALPHLAEKFLPGTIGENFSSENFSEKNVHIGDTFSVGSAIIQVSQPRRPCWKVNHKYGNGHLVNLLMQHHITGWYYRVVQEGIVQAGDEIILTERLSKSISIAKLWQQWIQFMQNKQSPHNLKDTPGLALEWLK